MLTHLGLQQIAYDYALSVDGLNCVSAIIEARLKGRIAVKGYRPDVLAWRNPDVSITIECKTSRADSLAELNKEYHGPRHTGDRLGNLAYLIHERGIHCHLPDGYGRLVVDGGHVEEWVQPTLRSPVDRTYEASLAFAALARLAGQSKQPSHFDLARDIIQKELFAGDGKITVENARKLTRLTRGALAKMFAGRIVTIDGRDFITLDQK